ncbi:MAG: hypothetical protein HQ512_07830 [Rhodospirillales bacterium]|nr:hypothetical protein [Rhodospirillales bacterium]
MKALWPPENPDLEDVMKSAEALGISEYDFFHLSFRRWFCQEPDDKALEQAFVEYMFHQNAPPWVRHLTRQVLSGQEQGRLDAESFGALDYRRRQPLPRNGRVHIGAFAVGAVIYVLVLMNTTYDPATSVLTPCYGGPGFKVIFDMAYAVSGKQAPSCDMVEGR